MKTRVWLTIAGSDLSDTLLTAVLAYGAPALGLALFIAALGMPLLASGACVSQGALDGPQALTIGLLGSLLGDSRSVAAPRRL